MAMIILPAKIVAGRPTVAIIVPPAVYMAVTKIVFRRRED
jgi:hypothetical protein